MWGGEGRLVRSEGSPPAPAVDCIACSAENTSDRSSRGFVEHPLLWLATACLGDVESRGGGCGTHPLSVSTIRRLEHGQSAPRVGTVEILALGLGTTINRWIGS
jgi:hypothetical protein